MAAAMNCRPSKTRPRTTTRGNIDPGTYDVAPTPLHAVDSVQLVEGGPLRSVVRVTRSWQSSKFVQDVILYTGSDHVMVSNEIDWHETHVLLKAASRPCGSTTNRVPHCEAGSPLTIYFRGRQGSASLSSSI